MLSFSHRAPKPPQPWGSRSLPAPGQHWGMAAALQCVAKVVEVITRTGKGFSGKFSVQLNRLSYSLFIAFSFSFRLFRKIGISALGQSLSAGEDLFQG